MKPTRQVDESLFGVRATAQGILFVQPISCGTSVAIAGDFNRWSAEAGRMKRNDELGVYQICIPVPPGRHQYRLVVDGRWTADPYNPNQTTNPFGELNSVISVLADTPALQPA